MELTKRGEFVRNVLIAVALVLAFIVVDKITTPQECRKPANELSYACKELLFPNQGMATLAGGETYPKKFVGKVLAKRNKQKG